jgi:hypothetical protein
LGIQPSDYNEDGFTEDGTHLCELPDLNIYMPGNITRAGHPIPQTAQHIREALGHSTPSGTPGLRVNEEWMFLTYGRSTEYGKSGWCNAFHPCNTRTALTTDMACDEHPFRQTLQAGGIPSSGIRASLRWTQPEEVDYQGGDLSAFLGAGGCNIPKIWDPEPPPSPATPLVSLTYNRDSNYLVFPLIETFDVPSQYLCSLQ